LQGRENPISSAESNSGDGKGIDTGSQALSPKKKRERCTWDLLCGRSNAEEPLQKSGDEEQF